MARTHPVRILLLAVLTAPLAAQGPPPTPAAKPAPSFVPGPEHLAFEQLARLTRPSAGALGLQVAATPGDVFQAMSQLALAGSGPARAWCARHAGAAPAETAPSAEATAELYVQLALDHGDEAWLLQPSLDPLVSLAGAGESVRQAVAAGLAPLDLADGDPRAPLTLALRAMALAPRAAPDEARRSQARALLGELVQRFPGSPLVPRAQRLAWRLEHLTPGREAPELRVLDVDGNELRLADLRGRAVLIDVWTVGDADLLTRIAARKALLAGREESPLTILGVGRGENELAFRRALEELDLGWLCASEASLGGLATAAWRLDATPLTVLVDADGIVQSVDLEGPELEAAVDRVLSTPQGASPRDSRDG
jgi:hypothetical protein